MPMVMAEAAKNNPQQQVPEQFGTYMSIYLAVAGGFILLFGILRITSGVRLFYFKGRTLTILSLAGGLVGIASCYCSVTSVGLAIYGLIVMFQPAVIYAFQLGAAGWTASQIRDHFAAARLGMTQQFSSIPTLRQNQLGIATSKPTTDLLNQGPWNRRATTAVVWA